MHKGGQGTIVMTYTTLMKELDVDVNTCEVLVSKMEEIEVVKDNRPPIGMVSIADACFRISPYIDSVWQKFLQQEKEQ